MSREAFAKVNARQELLGLKQFANPRNCAAGTLRQLNSKVVKDRQLSMFVFNLQRVEGREFASHTEAYEFMKKQGIKVIHGYKVCHTADEVWQALTAIGENRGNLPYDIDGVANLYSGIFNNPFLHWGKYRRQGFQTVLPVSFQFHHTQMDGVQACRFLDALQREIDALGRK